MDVTQEVLAAKFEILAHLDEQQQQRRPLMGAEARALAHGGIRLVARATWVREARGRQAPGRQAAVDLHRGQDRAQGKPG